jgi:AraC-like DNA-binding protein
LVSAALIDAARRARAAAGGEVAACGAREGSNLDRARSEVEPGRASGIAGVSPFHLAHVFSKEVGTSVYRYAIRLRLANALNAVLDSNVDLTSIALDTGFASHSHFTARFREFFG